MMHELWHFIWAAHHIPTMAEVQCVVQFTIEAGQWVAVALLLVLCITRSYDARREILRHDSLWAMNAAVGFLCIIVLGVNWIILLKRCGHQHRCCCAPACCWCCLEHDQRSNKSSTPRSS